MSVAELVTTYAIDDDMREIERDLPIGGRLMLAATIFGIDVSTPNLETVIPRAIERACKALLLAQYGVVSDEQFDTSLMRAKMAIEYFGGADPNGSNSIDGIHVIMHDLLDQLEICCQLTPKEWLRLGGDEYLEPGFDDKLISSIDSRLYRPLGGRVLDVVAPLLACVSNVPNGDWRLRAACSAGDDGLLFIDRGCSPKHAKDICKICPVVVECIDFAIETDQEHGIWGGKTPRERRKLKKRAV